ncbi:Bacteriophytochrome (light-regulated signal transduction histidine kinase) [Roseovarius tolerans]|uniref:histidine kinase n=1 Tax=Roseovarius tolerans TaxID=74031 RepID=A0A1H7WU20_9RHOB|nr:ATP-binding protein [Roseovarius tolerans]SEM25086.1 Bacteriophytochrome (light-regulated signal transduction histidine kinase) [Roseovarius tolerans]
MTLDTVNLETCDREPIHLIGAVQPHGALIAIDGERFTVEFASRNTASFIGLGPEQILGKDIARLIGETNARHLRSLTLGRSTPDLLSPWFLSFPGPDGTRIDLECLPHRSNGHIVLELLHPEPAPARVWEDEYLRREFISELVTPGALEDLANASARIIRDVTGFDRVMIYRFAEDKHGEVIAESTNRPDSFLGLHYPASDIPDPARRHFLLNVVRAIPDINSERVPIISRKGGVADAQSASPLDLTFSKLRAVAPVHVEYLNNMGVAASLSISLVTNNQLWGLVACHNYEPREISSSRLRFAELLGSTTSALLQSIESTNQLQTSITAEKTAFRIEQQARGGTSLRSLIDDWAPVLMQLIDAQGMLLFRGDGVVAFGAVPDKPLDFSGLCKLQADGVATTAQLSDHINMDAEQLTVAAGAALLDLSEDGRDYLVFLRSDFEQTIRWAGKPDKVETTTEGGVTRLSPRGSFALWREERRGQSRPFSAMDRDALRILRRALFALNSLEHERAAREAQKTAEEKETRLRHALLDASRASSMGELASAIAHELNQPLSAISNYISACRQELRNADVEIPERAAQLIDEAVAETTRAGDLMRRMRNFISAGDLNAEYIDLNKAIQQGIDLALAYVDLPRLQVNLLLDQGIPRVLADPVQIGQVMLNLARNSIAAMQGERVQKLTVEVIRSGQWVKVYVRDTGHGIPTEQRKYLFEPFNTSTTQGMGIGLSLCRSIIEAHEGRIWAEPAKTGSVFVFQLPIEGANGEQA